MLIDKYYHLYGLKNEVIFEEIPKPEPDGRLKCEMIQNENEPNIVECTMCHHKYYWVANKVGNLNFCPNCGARVGELRGKMEIDE